MAERIDLFRRALAGAARAIAKDPEVDVVFASEPSPASGKTARVPSPGPALERRLVAEARGAADSVALRLRHHDARLHARLAPADADARAVFDALETARVEALGARAMGGVRENLARLTEARVRGDAIVRARTAEEVPLSTAVGLLARERLSGEAPPQAALSGLKLITPWIEDKAGPELDSLALTLDDQAAFAKLSRRLLEDLDLAAAEDLTEEPTEDGGDDAEGEQGGRDDADRDSDDSSPAGGDVDMRGEDADDGDADQD
ncbi:MAG TPA: cobaltochelatase subunit CobT, partial [Sphingomicrobium sp.]